MGYEFGSLTIKDISGWAVEKLGTGLDLVQEYGGKAWGMAQDLFGQFMSWMRGDRASSSLSGPEAGYGAQMPRQRGRSPADVLPRGWQNGPGLDGGGDGYPPSGPGGYRGGGRRGGRDHY